MEFVPIVKDEEHQQPVPSAWRTTLKAIADALAVGNYRLNGIADVTPLNEEWATHIANQIRHYGCRLEPLPGESWESSISMWQGAFWLVLVDLFTAEEGASDLVMHVKVLDQGGRHSFEAYSVHVP